MFRLPDSLTREKVMCNSLKLFKTLQLLYCFFYWKKYRLLRNDVPLERLDQAILEVIDNPEKPQQTTAIGTLFWQTLYGFGASPLATTPQAGFNFPTGPASSP